MNQPGLKQCKICPFFDKKRSMIHLSEGGIVVNPKNQPFCKAVGNWVDETTACEGLANVETKEFSLTCSKCKKVIGYFNVPIGEKGSKFGIMNFRYTPILFAYRPRADRLMGFECSCGFGDTRLGKDEFDKNPKGFPVMTRKTTFETAKFNEKKSHFLAEERSK